MKATLVDKPFDDPDWLYEVKWDGYRAVATINKGEVNIVSRNNLSFNDKFYSTVKLLKKWKINTVIDGEILVIKENGLSDFGALQNWRSEADGSLVYYVFDILWYEGKDLTSLPLIQRQAILDKVMPTDNYCIRRSKVFQANGIEFFNAANKMGLEGIIAKRADSTYTADIRSREWLKIKAKRRQEVVIAGYTNNDGSSKSFSALVLGVYDKGVLRYIGKVGTGFGDKLQKEMMAQFKPLITDNVPFDIEPDVDKPSQFRPKRLGAKPTWLKPVLVCEVAYAEITSEGIFRQPSFQGMREDKKAKDVILELPDSTQKVIEEGEDATLEKHANVIKPPTDQEPKTYSTPRMKPRPRRSVDTKSNLRISVKFTGPKIISPSGICSIITTR